MIPDVDRPEEVHKNGSPPSPIFEAFLESAELYAGEHYRGAELHLFSRVHDVRLKWQALLCFSKFHCNTGLTSV